MRRQAKPFTVEIKKSRKSGHEPASSSFLGLMEHPEPVAAVSSGRPGMMEAERLFGRFGEAAAEKALGKGHPSVPNRILPDLRPRPEPEPAAFAPEPELVSKPERRSPSPRPRAARPVQEVAAPPLAAEPPTPRPTKVARPAAKARRPVAPPVIVQDAVAEDAPASGRVRRPIRQRARLDAGLRAGERWKRRLPPALR